MLYLIRKIRQKLLSNNKVGTYLLYAIGKIFLVVIGILIALQFNFGSKSLTFKRLALSADKHLRNP